MKKFFPAILGALVVLCLVLGVFFYIRISGSPIVAMPALSFPSDASSTAAPSGTPLVREVPEGDDEYHSAAYRFSVIYPSNLAVSESDSGGDATFTFEDDKNIVGFQVYVQPFSGTQITEAQFKQDIPSGVRTSLKNITIDGATGASFYSADHLLGDTAEVWFIHGGYLYEVTTFKEQAAWLGSILQTWKFF